MGCDMDGNPFAYDSGSIFSWLWGKKKTAKKRDTPKKIAAICANPPASIRGEKSVNAADPKSAISPRTIIE